MEEPAQPKRLPRAPYGKSGRFRVIRSWPCPLCSFRTKATASWASQKQQHIRSYHPGQAKALALGRRLPALVKPGPDDVVRWQCLCCDRALLETAGATYDQAYAVRLKHWQDCRPTEPGLVAILDVWDALSARLAATSSQRHTYHTTNRKSLNP